MFFIFRCHLTFFFLIQIEKLFQIIQQKRRKFSKGLRDVDFAGFEAIEDVQDRNMAREEEEVEQLSDLDSGDESGNLYGTTTLNLRIISPFEWIRPLQARRRGEPRRGH